MNSAQKRLGLTIFTIALAVAMANLVAPLTVSLVDNFSDQNRSNEKIQFYIGY